jgi:uncharacterized repeat protein (TIGR04138 family)
MDIYTSSFVELLKRDRQYSAEAYAFVYEALSYAQQAGLSKKERNEPLPESILAELPDRETGAETESGDHISGQDLCVAARKYAINQYGFLAKTVLGSLGIYKTDDIGKIVYNLISIGQMRKTPHDCLDDFHNVYDFETAFDESYSIRATAESC